jgi:AcrR family transcriptional regulator
MLRPAPHDSATVVRRPPYGANPALGPHGLRARQEILDAARGLFTELGYHATKMESIGEAAGRSAAAVYQYFEGKGQIFEVLVDELTIDVLAAARRLAAMERVRPGPAALPELQARVAELSTVLTRHSTTFALWPVVEESEERLRGSARRFMASFAAALGPALVAAGVPAQQRRALAVAIGAMIQSAHSTRIARTTHLTAHTLDEVLARVVYSTIFPAGNPPERGHGGRDVPARLPRPAGARVSPLPEAMPGVRRRVTERSRGTLERILSAATDAFRRNGFAGTSINDIAAAAGVSHASVYTYWPDRGALFATLAHRAAVTVGDHIEQAPCAFESVEDGRVWLGRWAELIAEHGAVLHIWTHEVVRDSGLGTFAREMQEYVGAFLDSVVCSAPTAGSVDRGAARVVLWSLLTDVPYRHCSQLRVVSHEEFLDVQAMLLLRGLLGHR